MIPSTVIGRMLRARHYRALLAFGLAGATPAASWSAKLPAASVALRPTTRPSTAPARVQLEQALGQLAKGDWIEQWEAMEALAAWRSAEAVGPLQKILAEDGRQWVRSQALLALARIQPDQTLDQAITLTSSQDPAMKQAALQALATIGSPRGVDAAARLLDDASLPVRIEALAATGQLRRADAWNLVLPHLKHTDPLYPGAVRAAAWIPTAEARKSLDALLGIKDARASALKAIGQARDPEMIPILLGRIASEKDRYAVMAYEKTLATFGVEQLQAPLLEAIKGENAALFPTALRLLAPTLDREGCDLLATRLATMAAADASTLGLAFDVLAKFDAEAYVNVIAPYLKADAPEVRKVAALAVARARSADQFALMHDLLLDRDSGVRNGAYQTLRRSTRGAPPAGIVPYLSAALASPDKEIHRPAMELLQERIARTDVEPAVAALAGILGGSDRSLRDAAAKTLAAAADEVGLELIARAQGYCAPWMIVGPFAADDGGNGPSTPFGPKVELDFGRAYDNGNGGQVTWSLCKMARTDGTIDLAYAYMAEDEKAERAWGTGPRVAYGSVDLLADRDMTTMLTLAAQQGGTAWLNGGRLNLPARAGDGVEIRLNKGANRLLVKVTANDPKTWSFQVRLSEKDGSRATGVTSSFQAPATQPAAR